MRTRLGSQNRRALVAALLAASAALAVYGPAARFGFVSLDDGTYVSRNPMVLGGLDWAGWSWAWTTSHAANWHPLTWLSLMVDATLGGGSARVFHATNVVLHAANSALLFLALLRMTRRAGPSLFTALVFAVHPLHVESVAWITERKDVLSTFFWMLLLLAYARYSDAPSARRMALVTLCLAASLLAKPMLVTAPWLLLLLDHWPLGRRERGTTRRALLREKWPLFGLSLASCIVTLAVQSSGGALRGGGVFPLATRLANAAISCVAYLADYFWPSGLAVFYPHPGAGISLGAAVSSVALLALATAAVLASRRTRPCLTVGWLWFLVALAPVAGFVQVGLQARADRYAYVPLIGISMAMAFSVPDLWRGLIRRASPAGKALLPAAAVSAIVALAFTARAQVRLWESDLRLYEHALTVTRGNDLAHAALGTALGLRGDLDGARAHLDEALRLRPGNIEARHERAVLYLREGDPASAAAAWRAVLAEAPRFTEARAGFATALAAEGDWSAADLESTRALDESPRLAPALAARGAVRLAQNRAAEAEESFRAAVREDPASADYRLGLGNALAGTGRTDEAIESYREVLRLSPGSFSAHLPLGALLFQSGKQREGLEHLEAAVRLRPSNPEAQLNFGVALYKLGRVDEAAERFEQLLRSDPGNEPAHAYLRLIREGGKTPR